MYFIESGHVDIRSDDGVITNMQLGEKDSFGGIYLVDNTYKPFVAITTQNSELWLLKRKKFQAVRCGRDDSSCS